MPIIIYLQSPIFTLSLKLKMDKKIEIKIDDYKS